MTFRVLVTDDLSAEAVGLLKANPDIEFDVVRGLSPEGLTERITGYDGLIIRSSVHASADVIAAGDRLRVIGRAGVGVDNVDLQAAMKRGVIVMNTPGANTVATAEHTMALLLALSRNLPQSVASLRSGEWERSRFKGIELRSKTIGIVGLGRVGRRIARRCRGFGMEVICYDPYLSDDRARSMKVERVSFDELLVRSDFVTLHAALTPKTRGLIGREALARTKPGVRIINAARGDLVDEEALIDALQSGRVAGAALDVLGQEPPDPTNPLLHMDNVVVTPHVAASTDEAQREVGIQIVGQVIDALQGTDYRNAVNMPVVDKHVLRELSPYLDMAERLGSLQTQLAEDAITKIEIAIEGDLIDEHVEPISVAILKGLLESVVTETVNYVNAPHIAMERGIIVSHLRGLHTADYPNILSCRVEWRGGRRTIAATLFSHDEPRIVEVDDYRVDVIPEGTILVAVSHDEPGFIGKVGTMLGELGINIATWRTGRSAPGGRALSFIGVDADVPDEAMQSLAATDLIESITKVRL
ncbi:MAG: phosphoglycerate dehydrogenase [Actinomycetota bacterium]|nr:phosphoglycerate dehydrogenase [Actinomycetota bacterium]